MRAILFLPDCRVILFSINGLQSEVTHDSTGASRSIQKKFAPETLTHPRLMAPAGALDVRAQSSKIINAL
jgi:hypothetical protein